MVNSQNHARYPTRFLGENLVLQVIGDVLPDRNVNFDVYYESQSCFSCCQFRDRRHCL